jgi:exopolysaccharide biosynthesis protein
VRWFHGDSLLAPDGVVAGFQSYPTLLSGEGVVPAALRRAGAGVNLTHRDSRLALGGTRDGRILIAMTRFDAIGEIAESFPLGPTTPEMAAIMGALGACDAVMLDGGISAQLLLRDPARTEPLRWRGIRKVPLGLVARAREPGKGSRPPR